MNSRKIWQRFEPPLKNTFGHWNVPSAFVFPWVLKHASASSDGYGAGVLLENLAPTILYLFLFFSFQNLEIIRITAILARRSQNSNGRFHVFLSFYFSQTRKRIWYLSIPALNSCQKARHEKSYGFAVLALLNQNFSSEQVSKPRIHDRRSLDDTTALSLNKVFCKVAWVFRRCFRPPRI